MTGLLHEQMDELRQFLHDLTFVVSGPWHVETAELRDGRGGHVAISYDGSDYHVDSILHGIETSALIRGQVAEQGGGYMNVLVDRDTQEYIASGRRVEIFEIAGQTDDPA